MAERLLPTPDVFATCPTVGRILEFKPATYPDLADLATIVANRVPVSWTEVASKAGLPSIAAIDIGLRTMILGLKVEFSNQECADRVESLAESHQILPPSEGCFSDLLHDRILKAIQGLGYAAAQGATTAVARARAAHSACGLNGLDMKSSIPAARQRSWSPLNA